MAITKLHLKNFTVFEEIIIDFCEGVNIFIGENGTGKTHLMKVMYFFTKKLKEPGYEINEFEKIFMVKHGQVIRNMKKDKEAKITCVIDGSEEEFTTYLPRTTGTVETSKFGILTTNKNKPNTIFIPTKEMLSHSKGFLAMNEKYEIPFDKTLIDIIVNAELPEIRGKSVTGSKILSILSDIIDGEVLYENDVFYVKKKNGLKMDFSLEAEGFRKIGLLWKLIRNGLIEKGTILFWDEPEANLNPQHIPILVEILLELQRNGVQIFIATHEYNLAKYFEVKRKDNDEVLYHCLYKTDNGVKSSKAENYRDIEENPIEKANEILYDDILDKAKEELNRE